MPKSAVGYKIKKLMKEGYPHKQAIAIALKMRDSGELGPRGGYKKRTIRKKTKKRTIRKKTKKRTIRKKFYKKGTKYRAKRRTIKGKRKTKTRPRRRSHMCKSGYSYTKKCVKKKRQVQKK